MTEQPGAEFDVDPVGGVGEQIGAQYSENGLEQRDRDQSDHQHVERAESCDAPAPCRSRPGRTAARPAQKAGGRTTPPALAERACDICKRRRGTSRCRSAATDRAARRAASSARADRPRAPRIRRASSGAGAAPRATESMPRPRPTLPSSMKQPSRSAAIAGNGVRASRFQLVRQARARRPNSLAPRSISWIPNLLTPKR